MNTMVPRAADRPMHQSVTPSKCTLWEMWRCEILEGGLTV